MTERRRFDAGERAAARSPVHAARRDVLAPGERWADAWLAVLAAAGDVERERWEALLRLAAGATQPRATPEWRAAGRAAIQAIGVDALRAAVSAATARLSGAAGPRQDEDAEHAAVADGNASVLRGLVWLSMLDPWPALPALLAALCTTCMATVPRVGPRAQSVANACIAGLGALAASPDAELRAGAVAHLAHARENIHDRATKVAISTAIGSAAAAQGMAAHELEALAAPESRREDDERAWRAHLAALGLTRSS